MNMIKRSVVLCALLFIWSCDTDKQQPEGSGQAKQTAVTPAAPVSQDQPNPGSPMTTTTQSEPEAQPAKTDTATEDSEVQATATMEAAAQGQTKSAEISGQEEMLGLAKKSGCFSCHALDRKLVGPAWQDVAKRYQDDASAKQTLIAKVKKGGKGNWTEVTGGAVMPPYSPRVSDDNIGKLVEFILSL